MVTAPKVGVELPERVVVPPKVMVPDVSEEAALLTKFPFKVRAWEPTLKVPLERVRTPFTVTSEPTVSVPDPVLDRFANAVALLGSSGPLVIVPEV